MIVRTMTEPVRSMRDPSGFWKPHVCGGVLSPCQTPKEIVGGLDNGTGPSLKDKARREGVRITRPSTTVVGLP